jgi:hypothetical protein
MSVSILVFLTLTLGTLICWRWISARKKRIERINDHYSIRVVEDGRDPFDDRFELHLRKRE